MPKKAKFGFCLLAGLLLAIGVPSLAMANHEGYSTEGFGGVQPHVAQAGHEIQALYDAPYVSGYRAGDGYHGDGLALDFMVYDDTALGDQISNHVLANWEHYNVDYIIWQQRINFGSGWQLMEDRGSPTENHEDHVHVSFNPQSSTTVEEPAKETPEMEDPSTDEALEASEQPVTGDDIVQPASQTEPQQPVIEDAAQPTPANTAGEDADASVGDGPSATAGDASASTGSGGPGAVADGVSAPFNP